MQKRAAAVTFKGNPMTLVGPQTQAGRQGPGLQGRQQRRHDPFARRDPGQGSNVQRRPVARHAGLQHADARHSTRARRTGRQGRQLHRQPGHAIRPEAILHGRGRARTCRRCPISTTARSATTTACCSKGSRCRFWLAPFSSSTRAARSRTSNTSPKSPTSRITRRPCGAQGGGLIVGRRSQESGVRSRKQTTC